jgi:hypothetical protein
VRNDKQTKNAIDLRAALSGRKSLSIDLYFNLLPVQEDELEESFYKDADLFYLRIGWGGYV